MTVLAFAHHVATLRQCPVDLTTDMTLGIVEYDPRVPVVRVHPDSDIRKGPEVPVFSPYRQRTT